LAKDKKDPREALAEKWFPAKGSTPSGKVSKGHELASGGMLHSENTPDRTILVCWTCKKPLWIIWPLEVLSKFSTFQKPATPIGHKWNLEERTNKNKKGPDFTCPLCGGNFAKFNEKFNTAQYMTDKGII
jgi:hypothetical protein